jgi:hypothetical protein
MMGSRRVRLTMTAGALAALLAAPGAHAQVSAADRETARSMMQEGRDLREKGDLKGALQRFKTADDIMHVPTTSLEVARAQVALGQLIEALDTIAAIHKVPVLTDDPAPFKDARNKADELDAQVEGKVPSLSITVTGAAEGETPAISVDGVSLPAAAASVPRKVDPGHHVVTARAASGQAKEEVDVTEGEKKDVALVLVAGGGDNPEGDNGQTEPGPSGPHNVHTPGPLTWGGIVVGGVGLVVGSITGLMTLSKASTVKSDCNPNTTKMCTDSGDISALNSGNSLATVSTISFAVAGAGAVVAVVSLIVGHKPPGAAPASAPPADPDAAPAGDAPPPPASESHLHVTPWIGLGSAGLVGTF